MKYIRYFKSVLLTIYVIKRLIIQLAELNIEPLFAVKYFKLIRRIGSRE